MSARRALAVSALSLLVPASLVLVTAAGSASETSGEPAASTSARRNVDADGPPRGVATDRPAGWPRGQPRGREGGLHGHLRADRRRPEGEAPSSARLLLADGGHGQPGQERPCPVRRPRERERPGVDLPGQRRELPGPPVHQEQHRQHRALAHPDLDRRVLRRLALQGLDQPREDLRAAEPAQVLQGERQGGPGRRRRAAAQRPQGSQPAHLVPGAQAWGDRRQVRLPAQRPHRHRRRLLLQVRRRRCPHQVPPAARPARQLLDAAGRRDVPRWHRPRDRRHRVLRGEGQAQRPLQLHPPLRGEAASSRPAPPSRTRSSTARATAGGRTSTSSPCSGRRDR